MTSQYWFTNSSGSHFTGFYRYLLEHLFNDKFILGVLSLKQIEHATDEDKDWGLDTWAHFFVAKTWRDIKMIAKNNEILTSTSKTLYEYNSDWLVREQCRAREDYENHERNMQQLLDEKDQTITAQATRIRELEDLLNKQNN